MTEIATLLQQGTTNLWLFIPSAILLGAFHGLEPGHSKTMMAAFIIAIRGTVWQAILLGLSAAFSHTLVVWVIALGGMYFGQQLNMQTSEPYFQIASAVIIIGVALWMLRRTIKDNKLASVEAHHDHGHAHHEEIRRIDTGHGVVVEMSVMEDGVPPRFWLVFERGGKIVAPPTNQTCTIETVRSDGSKQVFAMIAKAGHLESVDEIPEPHEFKARLSLAHEGHSHDYDVAFTEHAHGHDHDHAGLDVNARGFQDAHELAHANDIKRRFADQNVTTGQIVIFGLTGGLIPCPAAITVLLLCLQLKKFVLGVSLVFCFSIGLAATMVIVGVAAALSVQHISRRWSGFSKLARRAPYFSSALIMLIGTYIGIMGLIGLVHH